MLFTPKHISENNLSFRSIVMWKSCKNHAATQREQNFSHSGKWDLLLSCVPSHSLQISADLSLENPGEYFTTILPLIEWKNGKMGMKAQLGIGR